MKLLNRDKAYYDDRGGGNTAREIAQQPHLWRELADILWASRSGISDFMEKAMAIPDLRVIFTGAGSSAFIGESMQMLLTAELGLRAEAIPTTDITATPDSTLLDVPTLLVSYSRSGESPESIGALEYASSRISQLYNLVLVCKEDSPVSLYADQISNAFVLKMPAKSCDLGFAMTSSVSCMALATWCVFGWKTLDYRLEYIRLLADSIEQEIAEMAAHAQTAAGWFFDRAVYLGCGALRGLAREAAVKMLELSSGMVNAGWDTSTGFRHGPKSVINDTTLTVHLLSPGEFTRCYDIDLLNEVVRQQKNNHVAVITASGSDRNPSNLTISYELVDGDSGEICAYIKCLVFVQLLALEKSLSLGVNSDDPNADGLVNRVVQGVKVYPLN